MQKSILLFALLTLSVGLWAETVSYVYPVYNNNDVTKGIEKWETTTVDATELTELYERTTLAAGWYVVKGENVERQTLVCEGAVYIILADGAKLTASGINDYPGIQVSGEGNSLTIYGQTAQSGQLIATSKANNAGIGGGQYGEGSNITINGGIVTATGGDLGAGIGGGQNGEGSNITINGGRVTANGGLYGAGIGGGNGAAGSNITINGGIVTANGNTSSAGIGGGEAGSGSKITINDGDVTATGGGFGAAGIGGGIQGLGSQIYINGGTVKAIGGEFQGLANAIGGGVYGGETDIFVTISRSIKAGNTENPTEEIENTGGDIASRLKDKRYVTIEFSISAAKAAAIAEINDAIATITNENIIAIATTATNSINAATTEADINAIKEKALADIELAITFYNQGKNEAFGAMGTKAAGHAIRVSDGTTSVILYNPQYVSFIQVEE